MRFPIVVISSLMASLCLAGGLGEDLKNAPPAFSQGGRTIVPVDFQFSDLKLVFDVSSRKATGYARIEFFSRDAGYKLVINYWGGAFSASPNKAGKASIPCVSGGRRFEYGAIWGA